MNQQVDGTKNKIVLEMFDSFANKGLSTKDASILTQLKAVEMFHRLAPHEKKLMNKLEKKLK